MGFEDLLGFWEWGWLTGDCDDKKFRDGVLDEGQVEMEGLEMESGGGRSSFACMIGLTQNPPSRARKRENSRNPKITQENSHSSLYE